jgi:polyisoprenoid-binding protein YceI
MAKWNLMWTAGLALLPGLACAAPMSLDLTPGNMLAQTHSHGMMLPVTGTFRQLSGKLNYDPATGACSIDATFVVVSLELPNAMLRDQTMSKGFLDPTDYPTQHYEGTCQKGVLVGNLTMHGQTHGFNMTLTPEPATGQTTGMHLEGVLNRHDWGINGLNLLVGDNIRITNDISLNGQPPVAP